MYRLILRFYVFQCLFFSESVCIVAFRMILGSRIVTTGSEYYFPIRIFEYLTTALECPPSWLEKNSCTLNIHTYKAHIIDTAYENAQMWYFHGKDPRINSLRRLSHPPK